MSRVPLSFVIYQNIFSVMGEFLQYFHKTFCNISKVWISASKINKVQYFYFFCPIIVVALAYKFSALHVLIAKPSFWKNRSDIIEIIWEIRWFIPFPMSKSECNKMLNTLKHLVRRKLDAMVIVFKSSLMTTIPWRAIILVFIYWKILLCTRY